MIDKVNAHCPTCNETFDLTFEKTHVVKNCINCGTLLQLQCNKCKKLFRAYKNARGHVITVCYPREFDQLKYCHECDYSCVNKSDLARHIQRNHSNTNASVGCNRCGRQYSDTGSLKQHKSCCGEQPHLHCKFCYFKTKYVKSLTRHIRGKHKHVKEIKIKKIMTEIRKGIEKTEKEELSHGIVEKRKYLLQGKIKQNTFN